jgi:hypothetical protein
MEPRKDQPPKHLRKEPAKKKQFRIVRLEERIAPRADASTSIGPTVDCNHVGQSVTSGGMRS